MNDTINKDTLKPGDMVGIKVPTRIGWGFFFSIPQTFDYDD